MSSSAQVDDSNVKTLSLAYLEKYRYGFMSVTLLIVGCLGGIAVGVGALNQVVSLCFLALTTMGALSMMLAVAPIKYILYTSVVAVVVDVIIILINLIG